MIIIIIILPKTILTQQILASVNISATIYSYNKINFSKISLLLIGKSSGFNPKNYSKYLRNLKLIIRY
jgi:hypothetical protein